MLAVKLVSPTSQSANCATTCYDPNYGAIGVRSFGNAFATWSKRTPISEQLFERAVAATFLGYGSGLEGLAASVTLKEAHGEGRATGCSSPSHRTRLVVHRLRQVVNLILLPPPVWIREKCAGGTRVVQSTNIDTNASFGDQLSC